VNLQAGMGQQLPIAGRAARPIIQFVREYTMGRGRPWAHPQRWRMRYQHREHVVEYRLGFGRGNPAREE